MRPRYCVFIVESTQDHPGNYRKLLVAKFAAVGDAVAYAMHRRDTDTKGWTWVVETDKAIHSMYTFEPLTNVA